MRLDSPRGSPFPDVHGDELVRLLLAEIEEEERLAAEVGVDLAPGAPDPSHAPLVYAPLDEWLRRSEEIHQFLEQARRAERRSTPR